MANSRNYSNTAVSTTLNGSITNVGTSVVLTSQSGMPTPPFLLCIEPDTVNEELVLVNSGSGTGGSPYVVVRAQDGTTGVAHASLVTVQHRVAAVDFTDSRTHEANAGPVHGLATGMTVVGGIDSITSSVTVANTLTETTISKSFQIPGNSMTAGTTYRITAYGTYGNTGTPTMTFKVKYGGTILGTCVVSLASGVSGGWQAVGYVNAQTVGGSGNLGGSILCVASNSNFSAANSAALQTGISTTSNQNLTISVTWSAASSSNTITALGSVAEQIGS